MTIGADVNSANVEGGSSGRRVKDGIVGDAVDPSRDRSELGRPWFREGVDN